MKILILILCLFYTAPDILAQQAELHINNNSDRTMEIKIMRSNADGSASLHSRLTINPQSNGIKYFPTTGYFFLKVKASRYGRPTAYTQGDPFKVYVGADGYDVLTISYSIEESTLDPLSGETISQAEFDRDN